MITFQSTKKTKGASLSPEASAVSTRHAEKLKRQDRFLDVLERMVNKM